ncbi:MAG: TetR/AcrR family transcriptional regulator [Clostridiales bacterium]|nr:TetR/AcrR family transcriptional regulator [Clostridiales bacterium]
MGKRQALAEYHRGSILAAAERLFSERGTERTTMDDIAREAEYSKATLYVYFESKEEIVGTILLNGLAMLKKKVHQAIASHTGDWYAAYDAVCGAITDFYEENPTAYEAVMGGSLAGTVGAKSDQDIRRVANEFCAELAQFLEEGMSAGTVSASTPPMETVMLFWASASGMIHMADCNTDTLTAQTGKTREEFLRDGFYMILRAITSE